MSVPKYSEIDDDPLDDIILEIIQLNPNAGEKMVNGTLLARGVIVQRERVRKSIKKIDPNRSSSCKKRIYRHSYNVPCPNALWLVYS